MTNSGKAGTNRPDHSSDHLQGQRVLVTRPLESGEPDSLRKMLESVGASVISHPVIRIKPLSDWSNLDRAISRLPDIGTIVFLSGAGVQHFFDRYETVLQRIGDLSVIMPAGMTVAAIGDSTAAQLAERGCKVDLIPPKSNSQSMGESLIEAQVAQPVLLIRANRGSNVLGNLLREASISFDEVTAYRSEDVESVDPAVVSELKSGGIDWLTITSSAIARSSVDLFGDSLKDVRIACISPVSATAIRELGFKPDVVAKEYNFAGLVKAMAG